jgi:hypothetical protein
MHSGQSRRLPSKRRKNFEEREVLQKKLGVKVVIGGSRALIVSSRHPGSGVGGNQPMEVQLSAAVCNSAKMKGAELLLSMARSFDFILSGGIGGCFN